MVEFLTGFYEQSGIPVLTAFLLGLLTAISPCPMATNITAIGYIGKEVTDKRVVFYRGLIYTLGRALSYSGLALILYFGADQFRIASFFQLHGEKLLGPLMIIIGILISGIIHLNFPGFGRISGNMEKKTNWSFGNVLLLGIVFALAFCPYSGVLYFGILIPMSISSAGGMILPVVYALATGIPVIIAAWLMAFAISRIGEYFKRIKQVEFWTRRAIAVLFIAAGIYYTAVIYF